MTILASATRVMRTGAFAALAICTALPVGRAMAQPTSLLFLMQSPEEREALHKAKLAVHARLSACVNQQPKPASPDGSMARASVVLRLKPDGTPDAPTELLSVVGPNTQFNQTFAASVLAALARCLPITEFKDFDHRLWAKLKASFVSVPRQPAAKHP